MLNPKKDIIHHFMPISIFSNMLALLALVFFTAGPVLYPNKPGVIEHKYYAPGVGFILETDPEGECVVPEGVL